MKDEIFYYLAEDYDKVYVNEHLASYDLSKAKRFESIEEMVTTVPIMKDWNWDYELYVQKNGVTKKVKEKKWMDIYKEWKKENPDDYNKLYNKSDNTPIVTFRRILD